MQVEGLWEELESRPVKPHTHEKSHTDGLLDMLRDHEDGLKRAQQSQQRTDEQVLGEIPVDMY